MKANTSQKDRQPPLAGRTYESICKIVPRRVEGGFVFDVHFPIREGAHVAELTAPEIQSYHGTRKAVAAHYGAWLYIPECEERSRRDEWTILVQSALHPAEAPNMTHLDLPAEFHKLTTFEERALLAWIRGRFEAARTVHQTSSYGLKHVFEDSPGGFYVTNGAFKGAMLAAGFEPTDDAQNSLYRIKVKR